MTDKQEREQEREGSMNKLKSLSGPKSAITRYGTLGSTMLALPIL